MHPYQPTYCASIYMHLFLFVTIFENFFESLLRYDHLCESIFLSLYENKQAYESHHLNLLSSKHDNDILLILYVPILCFFALNSSHFMSDYFLVE